MFTQVLGKVYAVLGNAEQRAVYDEQGVVDEESDTLRQDTCWEDFWRLLFPTVSHYRVLITMIVVMSYDHKINNRPPPFSQYFRCQGVA